MFPEKTVVVGSSGQRPGQHVLKVTGPIRLDVVEPLQHAVKSTSDPALIIDMTEVPYIDSAAIGVLVQTYVACRKSGQKLALVGLSARVRNVLHLTSVDVLFNTFESLSQAEDSLA